MVIHILEESKGYIDADYALDGTYITLYTAVVADKNGRKLATVSGPMLPTVLNKINKEIIKLNKNAKRFNLTDR